MALARAVTPRSVDDQANMSYTRQETDQAVPEALYTSSPYSSIPQRQIDARFRLVIALISC
jgi:hypothetical protein